jgi:hypothetical protein
MSTKVKRKKYVKKEPVSTKTWEGVPLSPYDLFFFPMFSFLRLSQAKQILQDKTK